MKVANVEHADALVFGQLWLGFLIQRPSHKPFHCRGPTLKSIFKTKIFDPLQKLFLNVQSDIGIF
jgi:hypothetical protein